MAFVGIPMCVEFSFQRILERLFFLDCYGKWEYSAAAYIKICITAIHTFEYGRAC